LAYGRITHEYRKQSVNGASPLQLVIMMYDGALKFMEAGKHAIAHQDLPRQNDQLQKAQKVVLELMACIDQDQGGDVARNLISLYTYVLNELVKANCEDSAEPVERCIKIFSELRDSWVQIEAQTRGAQNAGQAVA
jgi:flagellar protein FliS